MKLQAAISSLGLCVIFGAGPLLAANPVEGLGDTSTRPGLERQDTGMSDPTVNPGQAAGTRTVQGSVVRSQDGGYVIRDAKKRGGQADGRWRDHRRHEARDRRLH